MAVSPHDPHYRHRDWHEAANLLQETRLEALAAPLNPPRCTLTEASQFLGLDIGLTAAVTTREIRLERGDECVDLLCGRIGGFRGELFLAAEGVDREARTKRVLPFGLRLPVLFAEPRSEAGKRVVAAWSEDEKLGVETTLALSEPRVVRAVLACCSTITASSLKIGLSQRTVDMPSSMPVSGRPSCFHLSRRVAKCSRSRTTVAVIRVLIRSRFCSISRAVLVEYEQPPV